MRSLRTLYPVLLFHLLLLLPGASAEEVAPPPMVAPDGVVFVLDGSGNLRRMTGALEAAVTEAHLPLCVQNFDWSHGLFRIFMDLHCCWNHRCKGELLAGAILAHRTTHPAGKIYIVAHSAGAAVTLAAAECLPPGAVDRIILLAPALSPSCDLRPALRAARCGIDVVVSHCDLISLGQLIIGTADGYFCVAAGFTGFKCPSCAACDAALYENLRHHGWECGLRRCGHHGGHYGCTKADFLRDHVVPLLCAP